MNINNAAARVISKQVLQIKEHCSLSYSSLDLYHFNHTRAFSEKCKPAVLEVLFGLKMESGFNTEIFGKIRGQTYFPVSSMTHKNTTRDSIRVLTWLSITFLITWAFNEMSRSLLVWSRASESVIIYCVLDIRTWVLWGISTSLGT